MKRELKDQLFTLVASCEDEALLEEARNLLQQKDYDWWDELSEEDRSLVSESEAQYEGGKFITYEELMKQLASKKKK